MSFFGNEKPVSTGPNLFDIPVSSSSSAAAGGAPRGGAGGSEAGIEQQIPHEKCTDQVLGRLSGRGWEQLSVDDVRKNMSKHGNIFCGMSKLSRYYHPYKCSDNSFGNNIASSSSLTFNGLVSKVLMVDQAQADSIWNEYTRRRRDVFHSETLPKTLSALAGVREYYLQQRCCTVELIVELHRIANTPESFTTASISDCCGVQEECKLCLSNLYNGNIVDTLLNNLEDILHWTVVPLHESDLTSVIATSSVDSLNAFKRQHEAAWACSLTKELGLILDALLLVFKCGAKRKIDGTMGLIWTCQDFRRLLH